MPTLHPNRFPGESPAYRETRNKLLEAEIQLRKSIEDVAALRRKLPLGGEVPQDYVFTEGGEKKIRMSELFQPGKDTLAIYSYMFGPNMKEP